LALEKAVYYKSEKYREAYKLFSNDIRSIPVRNICEIRSSVIMKSACHTAEMKREEAMKMLSRQYKYLTRK